MGLSQLLTDVYNCYICIYSPYTYLYIYMCIYSPKTAVPTHSAACHAHKVDTSPAFHQYHAEEIGYTTPIIFNWVVLTNCGNKCFQCFSIMK